MLPGSRLVPCAVLISVLFLSARAQVTVSLSGLGGNPDYRWRDTPGNLYAVSFRNSFEYGSDPAVTLTYSQTGGQFTGTLTATGLKPNFTYQLKLEGKPEADWGSAQGDDWSNQQLQNLGRLWDNIGYIIFDYLITDENGDLSGSFALNSSYHVVFRTDQRIRQSDDGPVITREVIVESANPAYDATLPTESVGIYGQRESGRPAPGSVVLPDGEYRVRVILTEESFHESSLPYGGNWAGAMGHDDVQFTIGRIVQTVQVSAGWNLISVPLLPQNPNVAVLFPGATSPAFAYNNEYTVDSTLTCGRGYWLKFSAPGSYPINGVQTTVRDVPVVAGWNMIGPLEEGVPTGSVSSDPGGIIASNFFGFETGYAAADSLRPGKGYWLKASQAGTLRFSSPVVGMHRSPIANTHDSWIRLTFQDSTGAGGMLYLGLPATLNGFYGLPPLPPNGIPHVRFRDGTFVDALGIGLHEVLVRSVTPPLKLHADNLKGIRIRVRDPNDKSLPDQILDEGRPAVILHGVSMLVLQEMEFPAREIPNEFALLQNYPNPFNPSTTIRFALHTPSYVTLTVHNTLGQIVRQLVNADVDAGYHQLSFDAAGLASGVYLYRMSVAPPVRHDLVPAGGRQGQTGSFVEVKKLILLH